MGPLFDLINGFATAMTPAHLAMCFAGVLLGQMVGVLRPDQAGGGTRGLRLLEVARIVEKRELIAAGAIERRHVGDQGARVAAGQARASAGVRAVMLNAWMSVCMSVPRERYTS